MILMPQWTAESDVARPAAVVWHGAFIRLIWRGSAHRLGRWSLVGLALAAVMALGRWQEPLPGAEAFLSGALRVDDFGVFLEVAILLAAGLALSTADGYLEFAKRHQRAEFHALALFAVSGMMLLVTSGELITLFLGLELLSFPTYVLCAFRREDIKSNESALKYFVLGSFASSIFLYGVALIWGATGTTSLQALGAAPESALLYLGILLLLVGFLFKVGAVPFHMWCPTSTRARRRRSQPSWRRRSRWRRSALSCVSSPARCSRPRCRCRRSCGGRPA
jgi:NADH-quinone oxidoreductase subunit N